jgi:hypothetical protein
MKYIHTGKRCLRIFRIQRFARESFERSSHQDCCCRNSKFARTCAYICGKPHPCILSFVRKITYASTTWLVHHSCMPTLWLIVSSLPFYCITCVSSSFLITLLMCNAYMLTRLLMYHPCLCIILTCLLYAAYNYPRVPRCLHTNKHTHNNDTSAYIHINTHTPHTNTHNNDTYMHRCGKKPWRTWCKPNSWAVIRWLVITRHGDTHVTCSKWILHNIHVHAIWMCLCVCVFLSVMHVCMYACMHVCMYVYDDVMKSTAHIRTYMPQKYAHPHTHMHIQETQTYKLSYFDQIIDCPSMIVMFI